MHRSKLRLLGGLALALGIGLVAAGCGSSSSTTTGSTTSAGTATKDQAVAAEVPAAIASKGTLKVASDASYPPMEFIGSDGTTVEGMDADLAKALASVMGLKAQVVNATFLAIIPGLASGKYDLGMSSFTDNKEREKVVDFVTYFSSGTSFYVKANGGPTINTLADLCGHTVVVEQGTTQAADAKAQSTTCKTSGKPGVTVLVFPDQSGANLALSSGRGDVGMADSPVAADIVKKSNGKFMLVGQAYGTAPYGIAIPKGNGMATPIRDALKVLMANGVYDSIIAKWGLQNGAVDTPQINGATG
jgi:polar amino acid transport system substrate-binding protein